MTTLDASAAVFKIPHKLFDLPQPVPRQSLIPPTSMRAMGTAIPRRRRLDGNLEAPSSGYKEYMLFALRTRLTPELQELIGRSVLVSYTGYPAPSMRLSFPGGDREPHINEQLRSELEALLQRETNLPSHQRLECMLLRWNSNRYLAAPVRSGVFGTDGLYEKIPSRWLRAILPFVPFDESLTGNSDLPKIEYRDHGLYCDCLHTAAPTGIDEGESYSNLYARLSALTLRLIRRWYDEGRIVDPEQSLVKKWRLEPVRTVGGTTLYRPVDNWGLSKLSAGSLLDMPVSSLLYELAKGRERSVAIRVGINLVDYHRISRYLFEGNIGHVYHFSGGSLHFIPKNLEDLIRVLVGVDQVLYGSDESGAVITLTASRLSWINMYRLIIQRSVSSDIVVYVRRDVEPVFVISFSVPMNTNVDAVRREVVIRARRTLVYVMDRMAKPGGVEPLDVHGLLDDSTAELPSDLSSPTVREYLSRERPEMLKDEIQF